MKKFIIAFIIILYLIPAIFIFDSISMPKGAYTVYDASNPPSASEMADSGMTYVKDDPIIGNIEVYTLIIIPILAVLLAITNIIQAIRMQKRKFFNSSKPVTLKTILIMKLVLLPYLLVIIIVWLLTAILGIVPVFMYVWFLSAIIASFGYLVGSVSVFYSISRIIILWRKNIISTKQCIIHSILQLLFIVDIIDLFYIYFKVYKDKTLSPSSVSQTD